MQRCLDLAAKALGHTRGNPMVGCVVVHEGKIIAEGYHEQYGRPHAEVNALRNITDPHILKNCTVYVSLEPCSHHGKTPPCADLLIAKGIKKLVVASEDPNPLVSGKGIQKLRSTGVEVTVGVLDEDNRNLNRRFFTFHEKKRPYIVLKWAQSLTGFIAPQNHQGQFRITHQRSNELVHLWRSQEMGILVGRKTIEQDDPQLNVRLVQGQHPIRLVIDPGNKITGQKKIMNEDAETVFFTLSVNAQNGNVKHVSIKNENFLQGVMDYLYQHNIISVLVEGGFFTLQKFIDQGLWDEARIFSADVEINNGIPSPVLKGKIVEHKKIDQDTLTVIHPL